MPSNQRLQLLQDDLLHTAAEIDTLCQALDGHALYLRHSIHKTDARTMDNHVHDLRDSACELRGIAHTITP
ncbi:hypothetical protein LOY46_16850 [Pseudomonas sichuanensis]|uniref:Uncharacterized protein n=1 Tax=Pseudomonas oryziphila TaxID=2894079 RepID=A0ABM7CSR2_9PSED|nr:MULTISPECIES: hypothetical protein [Pseudomonas]AZL74505.1 hypothetical protein EI693_16075 [Pseudomonas oryziphila]UVK81237.1 hypothetical protein LOY46_16850 [Pseudomonas sichuanensis]